MLWQVKKPGQVDLRVESPSHNVDRSLNDIKCDVIAALSSKLPSKMSEKGYDYKIGGAISKRRNDRSTKVFRLLLAHHQIRPTPKENIQNGARCIGLDRGGGAPTL